MDRHGEKNSNMFYDVYNIVTKIDNQIVSIIYYIIYFIKRW